MHHYYLRYKQQKNRSFIKWKRPKLIFGNSGLVCLSSGFISANCLKRFCIVFKKRLKSRKAMTRYWVRICYNYIFTKKSANTRMGKGKGGIKSYGCYYHSGNSLVEFFNIRNGLLRKLLQYIRVRCAFRVWAAHYTHGSVSLGKLFFKNASITRFFFKKKKSFPTLKKNFEFIVFKLLLDSRFYDTRRIKSVFWEIEELHDVTSERLYIGRDWIRFIGSRLKRRNKHTKLKVTTRIPFFKIYRYAPQHSFNVGLFIFFFLKKIKFVRVLKNYFKLIFSAVFTVMLLQKKKKIFSLLRKLKLFIRARRRRLFRKKRIKSIRKLRRKKLRLLT
jgi:large subunit ribosomal protein L16